LHSGPTSAGRNRRRRTGSSADSADDRSFQFPAAVACHKHFVAIKADGNRVAGREFPWSVAIGGLDRVFPHIVDAADFDYDGRSVRMAWRFTPDFGFSLDPILEITSGDSPVANIDFFGAPADSFVVVWFNRSRIRQLIRMSRGFHKDSLHLVQVPRRQCAGTHAAFCYRNWAKPTAEQRASYGRTYPSRFGEQFKSGRRP